MMLCSIEGSLVGWAAEWLKQLGSQSTKREKSDTQLGWGGHAVLGPLRSSGSKES
jgi:hypothetical protein